MATIAEKWEFFLDVPGSGVFQAFPNMSKLEFEWTKTDFGYRRLELKTELTFYDKPADEIEDFTKVYPLERSGQRCERIKLIINKACGEGGGSEFFQGYFYVSDCTWNVSYCEFKVKVAANDPYQCIIDRWDEKINLLDYGTPVIIKDTVGELQYETCTLERVEEGRRQRIDRSSPEYFDLYTATECIEDEAATWVIVRNNVLREAVGVVQVPRGSGDTTQLQYNVTITTEYIREFFAGDEEPPGGGWTAVDGGFARPVTTTSVFDEESGDFVAVVNKIGEIPNALLFEEVLTNILQEFCPENSFVSNYFSINPDGEDPGNKHYLQAAEDYNEMYWVPKSELLNFGASDRATATPEITLKKLLDDLYIFFSVKLGVKDDIIYLEHESFFRGEVKTNLRLPEFEFYMKGNFKYSYINANIPKIEKWLAMDQTDEIGDFDLSSVHYQPCTTNSSGEKTFAAEVTSTNIEGIISSGRKEDGRVSIDGVALIAAEEKVVRFATGKVSGNSIANGVLAFPYVIENNHSWMRPQKEGTLGDEILQFTRAFPSRKWKGNFCIPCEDLENFDPDGRVHTVLMSGEIDSATYSDPGGIISLETLHE